MAAVNLSFNSKDVIHDMQQVMKKYRDLEISVQRKYIRAAMRKALAPWKPRFEAIAPVKSGSLKRSVATVTKFGRVDGSWSSRVGFTRSKALVSRKINGEKVKVSKDGSHAILVFEGTAQRHTKAGHSRGSMPRNSAAVAAWNALSDEVRRTGGDVFVGALRANLEKAIDEAERRQNLRTSGRIK